MAFTKYFLIGFLLAGLGACSSLSERDLTNAEELSENKQPNPYWENHPPIDTEVEGQFEEALFALQASDLQRARTGFESLTISHPRLSGPWVNLGIVHYQSGDLEAAESAWLYALKSNGLNNDAYAYLGLLYREQGRFDEAEAIYELALKKWPDNAEIYCNLGILYDLYTGDHAQALQQYLRCEQLMDEPSRQLRGWIVDLERRVQALAITNQSEN